MKAVVSFVSSNRVKKFQSNLFGNNFTNFQFSWSNVQIWLTNSPEFGKGKTSTAEEIFSAGRKFVPNK